MQRVRQVNHMYGGIGAAWGATLPILALMLVIPALGCPDTSCGSRSISAYAGGESGVPLATFSVPWSPYIDNRTDGAPTGSDRLACRAAGTPAPPDLRLVRYEFPVSFNPQSFSDRPLFACVLAAGDGTILAVRLPQRISGGAADRALVAAIGNKWHFEGTASGGAGWERVRLNQAPFAQDMAVLRF
jgi:hypothetical protein